MASTTKWRCVDTCYQYGKRFKKGAEFPPAWVDAGYVPNPPGKTWFVPADEYDDYIRKDQLAAQGKIMSAGMDPRPNTVLIEELKKYMGDIPKTWKRAQIWAALIARENAAAKMEPGIRQPKVAAKKEA